MRAIELFERCRDRGEEIRALEDAIEDLENSVTSCASGIGETVKSALGDRYLSYLTRKEGMETQLRLLKRKRAAEQVGVILLTDRLPEEMRDAVRLYYGRGRSIDQISILMNYSMRHIERLLKTFRDELKEISAERVLGVLPKWYRETEGKP